MNAAVTPVFILIMGLVAVICFSINAVLPAIILALGVFFISCYNIFRKPLLREKILGN